MTASDIATILGGLGVFVGACAAAYATVRNSRKISDTHRMVKQVDTAVNGKDHDQTTLVKQVQDLTDAGVVEVLARILAILETPKTRKKPPVA